MDQTLIDAFTEQVTMERQNEAAYHNLAIVLDQAGWRGMSHWMRKGANDEGYHAQKFLRFLKSRNVFVPLDALASPITANGDPPAIFQVALKLEQDTTEAINTLYFLAEEQEDPAAIEFLHWFIDEQRKSEAELTDILNDMDHSQGHNTVWTIIDRELHKGGLK
jgi:ferritin